MKTKLLIACLVFFISCNSNNPAPPSYEDAKMTIAEKERLNPVSFLEVTGTYRRNLINEIVLEGTISNTATVTTYKDVILRIAYYSKTKTELGTEEKTVFEYFSPGTTTNFKIKVNGYEGTESVAIDISSAAAVE